MLYIFGVQMYNIFTKRKTAWTFQKGALRNGSLVMAVKDQVIRGGMEAEMPGDFTVGKLFLGGSSDTMPPHHTTARAEDARNTAVRTFDIGIFKSVQHDASRNIGAGEVLAEGVIDCPHLEFQA